MPESTGQKNTSDKRQKRKRGGAKRQRSREAEILRLAYELREAGIAECGLGFALTTLGAEPVARALTDGEPFGRGARLRAVRSQDGEQRAAWTILSACRPAAVRRRLEPVGVASKPARATADRQRDRGAGDGSGLQLVAGGESFGEGASRTPLQAQLEPVAEALFGRRAAA